MQGMQGTRRSETLWEHIISVLLCRLCIIAVAVIRLHRHFFRDCDQKIVDGFKHAIHPMVLSDVG
jgi:hypothetical protein